MPPATVGPSRYDRSPAAKARRRLLRSGFSIMAIAAEAGLTTAAQYEWARKVVTYGKAGQPTLEKLIEALDRLEARRAAAVAE